MFGFLQFILYLCKVKEEQEKRIILNLQIGSGHP